MNSQYSGAAASSNPAAGNSPAAARVSMMHRLFWSRGQQTAHPPPPRSNTAPPLPHQTNVPQRRLVDVHPSPSLEPPQVSVYTLGGYSSPAYHVPPYLQPPARTGSDLQTISETEPASHGPGPDQPSSAGPSRTSAYSPLPVAARASPPTRPPAPGEFHFLPKQPATNPEGFKLDPIPGSRLHAEVTRGEASSQTDATLPILQQTTPFPIVLYQAALTEASSPPGLFDSVQPAMETESIARLEPTPSRAIQSLAPPVSTLPMTSPLVDKMPPLPGENMKPPSTETTTAAATVAESESQSFYDTTKPTCSLNLVCYRSGAKGCDLTQVQCALRSLFPSDESFQQVVEANPHLVHSDDQFFREMRRLYETQMCGFLRRYFSLKTLRAFRVLAYTPTTRPTVVPFDDFVLQEMMYAYRNPDRLAGSGTHTDWIQWVFRLRRKDRRHALDFVEGWNTTRIAVSGTVPWLASCLVGIIWSAMGGDPQTAFTVASFILTSSSLILALLAIISSIESSG